MKCVMPFDFHPGWRVPVQLASPVIPICESSVVFSEVLTSVLVQHDFGRVHLETIGRVLFTSWLYWKRRCILDEITFFLV